MDYAESQRRLREVFAGAAIERRLAMEQLVPFPDDSPAIAQIKADSGIAQLRLWEKDTVRWIEDNAWAPDPSDRFGSSTIPDGMSPKGMVPLLLSTKQREMVQTWEDMLKEPGSVDFVMDKCRQMAVTTLFLWWVLGKFLFRKSTQTMLSTFDMDLIDKGGKGQRDSKSLFGRLRMFLDAFLWNLSYRLSDGTRVSVLRFNQHKAPPVRAAKYKKKQFRDNLTGFDESDDVGFKLARPKWIVFGVELFPGAEGNWMAGMTPGDKVGRSDTLTILGFDEMPHYPKHVGAGSDEAAWAATVANSKCRFAFGTPPRGGGAGTLMHKLCQRESSKYLRVMHMDWPDLPVYMAGATWRCGCGHPNPLGIEDAPGDAGLDRACDSCGTVTRVTRFHMTSPWFEEACARMNHDRVGIAAELLRDWAGTIGDRFFSSWHESSGIRPFEMPSKPLFLSGFDPGRSVENPATWILACLDCEEMTLQIVGYWMAAETFVEWWVPYFKRWGYERTSRMRPIYGKRADVDRLWLERFEYDAEAQWMMERVKGYPLGIDGGDKSGKHRWMVESPYERLSDYRIDVWEEYTSDREELCRSGREWASRMTIDSAIADLKPMSPLNTEYPSLRAVFGSAKPRPVTGQGEPRLDVDKKDPRHVIQAADAWFYLVRLLDQKVHMTARPGGGFDVDEYDSAREPERYGGETGGIWG